MQNDRAYANGDFIAGAAAYPQKWAADAAAFRAELGARAQLDLPYGPGARHKFDLFLPEGAPRGLFAFVHGGYWLAFDRRDWSHLAAGAVAQGWACMMPSYTLAPAARISAITAEIAAALRTGAALVPGPVVVAGHSAGGHLAARLANTGAEVAGLTRVIPISPLADLHPLLHTSMNADLRLTPAECAAESPAYLPRNGAIGAHIWVGAQERPAFLWQARTLSEDWNCPWTVQPGKHHFNVIDDLADATSALMNVCLAGL